MKKQSILLFAALTAIFILCGTAVGQIPLPMIPGTGSSKGLADFPAETPVPEWIQTQEAIQVMQTEIVQTQESIAVMQTQSVWKMTLEAVNAEQTRIAQTQSSWSATQTQAAAPTATPTPTQRPTATKVPTNTPKPTQRPTTTKVPTNTPKPTAISVKAGDIITFGHYEQDSHFYTGPEPIEWRVLTVENERALLISKYGLDAKPYHEKYEYIPWEKCSLRQWLN